MAITCKRQVSLIDTKYYDFIARCVRRAFLCGKGTFISQGYEYHREWDEDKLFALARVFWIDAKSNVFTASY